MSNRLLTGKIALITGASKGIGKAITEAFARHGAIIYANARKEGSIDEWCADLSSSYSTTIYPVYFDVTDSAGCKQTIMQIRKESAKLDILVNNAGIVSYELLGMISLDKLRETLEVNVVAVINLIQLASRIMSGNANASIVNMASIVAEKGVEGQVAYSASKGAVIAITKSASKELASKGIRVNAVAPGMVSTERLIKAAEKGFAEKVNDIRMGRMVSPEEVADLVTFLASDMSNFVTGQIIGIDGSFKI